MSDDAKPNNPLAGLIGNYDSDPGSDDEETMHAKADTFLKKISDVPNPVAELKPSSIPTVSGCAWSACYDESSGYTYYWNQDTNEVTWEPPAEYLQALQVAQTKSVQNEVSSEEWQMYQQALAEKQKKLNDNITQGLTPTIKPPARNSLTTTRLQSKIKSKGAKPFSSDSEEETIELITSFHNKSDSESNDEAPILQPAVETDPVGVKKHGKKSKYALTEFGPSLPGKQEYSVEIGPQLPPASTDELLQKEQLPTDVVSHPQVLLEIENKDTEKSTKATEDNLTLAEDVASENNADAEDSQGETALMEQLLDKAKLLKRLGGELPSELSSLIDVKSESHTSRSGTQSPRQGDSEYDVSGENSKEPGGDDACVDEFLASLEQNVTIKSVEIAEENVSETHKSSTLQENIVKHVESITDESAVDNPANVSSPPQMTTDYSYTTVLFPSAVSIDPDIFTAPQLSPNAQVSNNVEIIKTASDMKGANLYMVSDIVQSEAIPKRKKRIASDVLPEVKKPEPLKVSYTTKYSHFIEGFSSERTGLGFKRKLDDFEEDSSDKKKSTGYLNFKKGETLNESKKVFKSDSTEELKSTNEILLSKLNFLNQNPVEIPPVQEMTIQLQTLRGAWESGGLCAEYFAGWLRAAARALQRLETAAAPPGWTCHFHREEGRYSYRRVADGHTQWDFPAGEDDMDICTTPPHVTDRTLPQAPAIEEVVAPPSPPVRVQTPVALSPPPPPSWPRTPPPPGTSHHRVCLPTHQEVEVKKEESGPESSKRESLGEELTSFYNDLAQLEKQTEPAPPVLAPPLPRIPQPLVSAPAPPHTNGTTKLSKKKTKVKISSSLGLKNKSVSSLVAKWQAVASEIKED